MTNEQILEFAASMNFAHLVVDSSCHMRYGRERWEQRLSELSEAQRERLVEKIQRFEAMRAKEVPSCNECLKPVPDNKVCNTCGDVLCEGCRHYDEDIVFCFVCWTERVREVEA